MQDVAGYFARRGLPLRGYLDPTRPARLDDAHLVRLNYEAFFFADAAGRERFLSDPTRYCGQLTDPVTKERFVPSSESPFVDRLGD